VLEVEDRKVEAVGERSGWAREGGIGSKEKRGSKRVRRRAATGFSRIHTNHTSHRGGLVELAVEWD